MNIEPPDAHYLRAAEGWLELGLAVEAQLELDRISPALQEEPEVLHARWSVLAARKEWAEALAVARVMIAVEPENVHGWINQSYSLHELKRTREAWEQLLPMAQKFAEVSTVPYNLACYACQMGDLEAANSWLAKAMAVGGKKEIVSQALDDLDLKPLWKEIKAM